MTGCTAITVTPNYTFAEFVPQFVTGFAVEFSGGCDFVSSTSNLGVLVNGTIASGETQHCTSYKHHNHGNQRIVMANK